jgi:hypothetical protein
MRFSSFLTVFVLSSVLAAPAAYARRGSWLDYIIPPPVPKFEQPYLNDGKIPHNDRWSADTWTPQGWIDGAGSAEYMMQDLYNSGIVTDQYESDGSPVLEVGPRFLQLSQEDQRRVVVFIDYVFNITQKAPDGVFYIRDEESEDPIGFYNQQGLHLQ